MKRSVGFVLLFVCALAWSVGGALAAALLGGDFPLAAAHDLVVHFEFKEVEKRPARFGLTEHVYSAQGGELLLGLGVTAEGKIVHVRLALPRHMIDEPKETLAGRDLVKSFLHAAMSGADLVTLGGVSDEVEVRGLDLQPVAIADDAKFEDSEKPVPKRAYKVGSGPVAKGDQVMFLEKMPALTKTPSEMYEAFAGKTRRATLVVSECRVAFFNDGVLGPTAVFVADAWNEEFWQKNIEGKVGGASTAPADPTDPVATLKHAMAMLATKDPVNSRVAERELDAAEKAGSKDFRIAALRAVASLQQGRRAKGLAALRDAIGKLPSDAEGETFRREMTAVANDVDARMKSAATVPVKDRHYTIPPGTPAVIADRDEATGAVTMGLSGGHDPDGGKQDGSDDGVIEVPWENINKPDAVFRAK